MIVNNCQGTVGNNLRNCLNELGNCSTVCEVKQFVDNVIPDKQRNSQKVKDMVGKLNKCNSLDKAYAIVTNFFLKGEGLGVIH